MKIYIFNKKEKLYITQLRQALVERPVSWKDKFDLEWSAKLPDLSYLDFSVGT